MSLRLRHVNSQSAGSQLYTSTVLHCCRCTRSVLKSMVSSRSSKATSIYNLTQIGSIKFWMSSLHGFTLTLQRESKLLNTGQMNMARLVMSTQLLTTWRQLNSLQQPSVSLQSTEATLNCSGRGMIVMQQSSGKMVSANPLTISFYSSRNIVYLLLQRLTVYAFF